MWRSSAGALQPMRSPRCGDLLGPTAGAKRTACSPANAQACGFAASRAQANRCVRRSCSETGASAGLAPLEWMLLSSVPPSGWNRRSNDWSDMHIAGRSIRGTGYLKADVGLTSGSPEIWIDSCDQPRYSLSSTGASCMRRCSVGRPSRYCAKCCFSRTNGRRFIPVRNEPQNCPCSWPFKTGGYYVS
jgi:hypothetical protein